MFTTFNQKFKTIFLDPDAAAFELDEQVNVILSPSLYWVKKLSLPVKYVRDAKKLLPSIFEDSLPDGNYSYSVYKEGDDFFAFAYDDKVILETLQEKGISSSNVAKVYFAQSELSFIEGAVKINETQSIYLKDDILILLPCCWVEESGDLSLEDVILSKHNITLAHFGHIVDTSSLYKIGSVIVALIILVGAELFITTQKLNEAESLKEGLFKKYKLQDTMFQNEAILKKYTAIHKKQINIRKYSSVLLSLKLQGDESIKEMNLKNKTFVVKFSKLSKRSEDLITKKFKSQKIAFKPIKDDKSFTLELAI
ncbi:MAG: hypothetical protein U9Q40_07300 [Campylobacterota bacterium]|nr:hypothetical protein [Campylobacterota bacterium]